MSLPGILCISCGLAYPSMGYPFHCPNCGGLFDISDGYYFDLGQVDRSQPGIWKYRHSFGLSPKIDAVSLGEGNTPLVWADVFGRRVAFKCEYLNPSGSFKDRGSTIIAAWLRGLGVNEAVEDSSGNAGASFAAYAARAGIKARIYVPESASGPKRRQIEAYGAELVSVRGSRTAVTEAVKKVAGAGTAYASHVYLPFNLSGYATAAYEVFDQLGQMPGTVIVPTGQGGLLLGLARGFNALRIANHLPKIPKIIGVQARACAPIYAMFTGLDKDPNTEEDNPTLAEGVRVRNPLRINAVLAAVKAGQGWMCAINETDIMPAWEALARLGFYVEPTSAIVWSALAHFMDRLPDPIVLILTGSGLKYGQN